MTNLKDEIQERLVTDAESILENHLDEIADLLDLHQDGTVEIKREYREVDGPDKVLIYLIGQRYAFEGDLTENEETSTDFFYERLDANDRTVRSWLQGLREEGYITKTSKSDHKIVVENLPDAIDRIKANK